MRTFRIRDRQTGASVIVCRKHVFSAELAPLRERLKTGGLLFTDTNVFALYRRQIGRFLGGVPCFVMPAGEAHKNEETLLNLLRAMKDANLRRDALLVALGGGVVGDIGGLAASLYMRGISCIQVPTTLLAQVDSSVGGKTAIDFGGVKNLIGAFHQPARVLVDPVFLKTLPLRELRCGLGEIVKHGALCPPILAALSENGERLFDTDFLAGIVPENIAFKASVVRRDPREQGLRACLNLGHTTAHTLELGGVGLSHGECVLLGMMIEGRMAERHGGCDGEYRRKIDSLCRRVLGQIPRMEIGEETARLALLDKKNRGEGTVRLTVSRTAGTFELLELPFQDFARELKEFAEEL